MRFVSAKNNQLIGHQKSLEEKLHKSPQTNKINGYTPVN